MELRKKLVEEKLFPVCRRCCKVELDGAPMLDGVPMMDTQALVAEGVAE